MGLISKNKSNTNTTINNDYTTNTESQDNRTVEAGGIAGGNITAQSIGDIYQTDHGAIDQAVGLAKGSFDFASNVAANAFTLSNEATNNALLFGVDSLRATQNANAMTTEIAGIALDKVYGSNQAALDFTAATNDRAFDFASDVQSSANETTQNGFSQLSNGVANAINKVSDVVKGANTSDSVQTIKYIALGAVGIAVAVFVFPRLFASK